MGKVQNSCGRPRTIFVLVRVRPELRPSRAEPDVPPSLPLRYQPAIDPPICVAASRSRPRITAASSMSHEMQRRPSRLQATAVVKPPPHGSTTRSPGLLKSPSSFSTSGRGCYQSWTAFSFTLNLYTSIHQDPDSKAPWSRSGAASTGLTPAGSGHRWARRPRPTPPSNPGSGARRGAPSPGRGCRARSTSPAARPDARSSQPGRRGRRPWDTPCWSCHGSRGRKVSIHITNSQEGGSMFSALNPSPESVR